MLIDTSPQELIVRGQVELKLYNKHGDVINERLVKNAVTNAGRSSILGRLMSNTTPVGPGYNDPIYMGVGTDSTPASTSNTDLQAAIGTRVVVYPTVAANVASWSATFNPGNGTGALREAGIWSGPTGSATAFMYARTVFDLITKKADDTLTIKWTITIS